LEKQIVVINSQKNMPQTQKHKNRLFLVRNKNSLGQKQVAILLGHKTTDQISRYERGTKLPSLKTAFKLGIIYRLPIQILLDGYYEACLKEIKKREKSLNNQENKSNSDNFIIPGETEFCTIEETLKPFAVKESDLDKARSHIAELIRTRAKRMSHL